MPDFYRINSWFIGMKKTKELLNTGDSVSAEEYERLGIVNQVVPADEHENETQDHQVLSAAVALNKY